MYSHRWAVGGVGSVVITVFCRIHNYLCDFDKHLKINLWQHKTNAECMEWFTGRAARVAI
jgi:hypothetical protein